MYKVPPMFWEYENNQDLKHAVFCYTSIESLHLSRTREERDGWIKAKGGGRWEPCFTYNAIVHTLGYDAAARLIEVYDPMPLYRKTDEGTYEPV